MTVDNSAIDKILGITESKLSNIEPSEEVNWSVVQIIVEKYTERHPEEVIGAAEYVKKLRFAAKDKKYGELSADSGRRHVMELPDRLDYALTLKYPKVFSGANLKKFFKLYPIFFIPEKI